MSFQTQRTKELEYQYRKLERGIRLMMKHRRLYSHQTPGVERSIERLRHVYQELGYRPTSTRWPV